MVLLQTSAIEGCRLLGWSKVFEGTSGTELITHELVNIMKVKVMNGSCLIITLMNVLLYLDKL